MANKLEISMDADALYREEVYTDRRMGTIRVLRPVDATGAADAARQTLYVGEAQLMTPMGTLPLSFELPADSLQAAIEAFPVAAEGAVDDAARQLEEMRREAASSIVVPGQGGGGGGGGMGGLGGAGGMPGGGIQLR